ncbi:hypothetical protein LW4_020 [Lactococcus phage LW4]|uniref:Uncharacterized protein n=4 Tax=Teubervirus LW31 TaxID=2845420 RepID=A0A1W6JHU5_9CAUD|nr:hypothetical protein H1N70_gp19 [Lactococcus phage LW31]ARM65621.1 hypothetical protein LW31_019 [Lactococcus phage LW31]ARM65706.1 hypothetical protein LW32_019 [Lactococcus phage LW32]ARM65794.1 hypothetical protein LW33_020 [Lactococcus phage LW33]ARM65880.1 hypothetical protein LW4_020 [Lactococcus phage LW4]
MVINANEARAKYDSYKIAAEQYINSVIEPQIKQSALNTKFITLEIVDAYYQGYYFKGYEDEEAPNKILVYDQVCSILEEAGYKLTTEVITSGNEYRDGYGYLTIDWS